MPKRKKLSGDEKIVTKILDLLALNTALGSLKDKTEKIRNELRRFIEKKFVDVTEKGYKFWEKDRAGAELRDNIFRKTNPKKLVDKITLKPAARYLSVDYGALRKDIETGKIPMTLEELSKITRIKYGKKKVIPYYGLKYQSKEEKIERRKA